MNLKGTVFLLLAPLVLSACATLPPAQPVLDLKGIVGKWEGIAMYSLFGTMVGAPTTLTIKEDGFWESTWPDWDSYSLALSFPRFSGQGYLREGKFHAGNSIYTLHEGGGKRVLVVYDAPTRMSLKFPARLEPAPK
jgi:hypothetical protein